MSRHAWTLKGEATVLDDYALTTTMILYNCVVKYTDKMENCVSVLLI